MALASCVTTLAPDGRAQAGTTAQRNNGTAQPDGTSRSNGTAQPNGPVSPDDSVQLDTTTQVDSTTESDGATRPESTTQLDSTAQLDTAEPNAPPQAETRGIPSAAATQGTAETKSDHSRFVGSFGIGLLGTETLGAGEPNIEVSAPIIGGRYWLSERMGIDAGLGIGMSGASTSSGNSTLESPEPFGLVLHGGLPLVLAESQHFVFQIVPELDLGFAGNTVESEAGDAEYSAFKLNVGARAGAEIHFGFIGIPQLALQAGIGLGLHYNSASMSISDTKATASNWSFGTDEGANPWDIFTSNISALYYFGG